MPATLAAVREMSAKWPKAEIKLVEDKANGPAVIQQLRHELSGLVEVTPEGGKTARAHAVSPQIESRNVYLPHPAITPWVNSFLEEVTTFPYGRNDDQVDAMTQALLRLRSTQSGFSAPEHTFVMDPIHIPEEWPRAYGMSVTRDAVAAVWGARDPSGTIYIYAEDHLPRAEPSENARAIKQTGAWIPGAISFSGLKVSQEEQQRITQSYRKCDLVVRPAASDKTAGIFEA